MGSLTPVRSGVAALVAVLVLAVLTVGDAPASPAAPREQESDPFVVVVGPTEDVVFSWQEDRCEDFDLPDNQARALRDSDGNIVLFASNAPAYRVMVGPDFDSLDRVCEPALVSGDSWQAEDLDHQEWIAATYTPDGRTVHALVHNEYHDPFDQRCKPGDTSPANPCWYNVLSYARSDDGGRTFSQPPSPGHVAAMLPFRWDADAMDGRGGGRPGAIPAVHGYLEPSNIVQGPDGAFYSLFGALLSATDASQRGTCLMRTEDLADPSSWRLWDGSAFTIPLVNPYTLQTDSPDGPLCAFVSPETIRTMRGSLTYSTYLERWLLLGAAHRPLPGGEPACGFYLSTSADLIDWDEPQLIRDGPLPFSPCQNHPRTALGIRAEVYPSFIDHDDPSANFTNVGQQAHLYFTRDQGGPATSWLDRDLVRVPVTFVRVPPGWRQQPTRG